MAAFWPKPSSASTEGYVPRGQGLRSVQHPRQTLPLMVCALWSVQSTAPGWFGTAERIGVAPSTLASRRPWSANERRAAASMGRRGGYGGFGGWFQPVLVGCHW